MQKLIHLKKGLLFAITLLVISTITANNKNIKFEHINGENGLPVSSITCIDQDKDGFIWMGSMEGLIKFNGYDFQTYRHIKNDALSLPGHLIMDLYCANDKKIYITIKGGGLSILDPETEEFTNLVPAKLNTYETVTINKMLPDSLGNIWLASDRDIYYFNAHDRSFAKLDLTNPLVETDTVNNFHDYYSAITFDTDNNLLILGHKGSLLHYNLTRISEQFLSY